MVERKTKVFRFSAAVGGPVSIESYDYLLGIIYESVPRLPLLSGPFKLVLVLVTVFTSD